MAMTWSVSLSSAQLDGNKRDYDVDMSKPSQPAFCITLHFLFDSLTGCPRNAVVVRPSRSEHVFFKAAEGN